MSQIFTSLDDDVLALKSVEVEVRFIFVVF